MSFIRKYPKIFGILFGFSLGMIVAGTNGYYAQQTITEFKRVAEDREQRYEEVISKSRQTITELQETNSKLKSSMKEKIVRKADGTEIIEKESNTDRSDQTATSVRTEIELEYERKLAEERSARVEAEQRVENRKLRVSVGIDTEGRAYAHGSYNFWGPVSGGIGADQDGRFMFDIGINL